MWWSLKTPFLRGFFGDILLNGSFEINSAQVPPCSLVVPSIRVAGRKISLDELVKGICNQIKSALQQKRGFISSNKPFLYLQSSSKRKQQTFSSFKLFPDCCYKTSTKLHINCSVLNVGLDLYWFLILFQGNQSERDFQTLEALASQYGLNVLQFLNVFYQFIVIFVSRFCH